MSENGTGLELLGFLGGTAKSKEAEAQKKGCRHMTGMFS